MSAPLQGNGAPPNPILQYYEQWSERTPYVTKGSTLALIGIYIMSFFFAADVYFGNIPHYSIFHVQIYRLITAPLVGNSILTVVLILIMYPKMGLIMESALGSLPYLYLLTAIGLSVNVCHTAVCLVLNYAGTSDALYWESSGFWIILFALITIDSLRTPELPRRLMLIPVDIPSKYMPLVLYGFFTLFGGPRIDFALSIAWGYCYSQGYLDKYAKLSSQYADQLESTGGWFHSISRTRGWVLSGAALGHDAWIPTNGEAITAERADGSSSSRSGGAQSGGAGGSAYGGFGGASTSGTAAEKPVNKFPGSGRKLTTSDGGGGAGIAGFSQFLGGNKTGPSREDIAARRLAALGAAPSNNSNNSNTNNNSTSNV